MKILLATDGSEYSEGAAKFLKNLKLSSDDEITILHVITRLPFKDAWESSYSSLKEEIASKIFESTIDLLKPVNAKINKALIYGYPDKVIVDVAEELNTNMIVLGARGLKGIESVLLGSVARSVAINSLKPVLVIKSPQWVASEKLRILFATDGSKYAQEAGRFLTVLPFHENTEVTILHVIHSGLDIPEKFHVEIDKKIKEIALEFRSFQIKESEKILEQADNLLSSKFKKINKMTKDGDSSIEILSTAKAFKTDIIAIGSRGLKGIKGMLGSVSRYILSHSECSVLIEKTM